MFSLGSQCHEPTGEELDSVSTRLQVIVAEAEAALIDVSDERHLDEVLRAIIVNGRDAQSMLRGTYEET